MAVFAKSNQQTDYSSNITTIATGSRFDGKIAIECALHVDGEFTGEISSTHTVTIGKNGRVSGELTAEKLIVTGYFEGNADCESIELTSGGNAEGKLISSSLTIDNDSSFQGQSIKKHPGESSTLLDLKREKDPFKEIDDSVKGNKEKSINDHKIDGSIQKSTIDGSVQKSTNAGAKDKSNGGVKATA